MTDEPTEIDPQQEFDCLVAELVRDTFDVLDASDDLRQMVVDGNFEGIIEIIAYEVMQLPSFDSRDIVDAAERRNGLLELCKEAEYSERLVSLAEDWETILITANTLSGLTWPAFKPKDVGLPKPPKKAKKRKKK